MLDHENIDVETNVDFFVNKEQYLKDFPKIVFTGMIDEFFDYKLGELEYRSLRFENETLDMENYQGNAVVNYTDAETPYTMIVIIICINHIKNLLMSKGMLSLVAA
ncbi:UDP-galactopyranose mutase [Streptococcus pneumoniae]|nr:UDP-galactopyranose mutase [Streptococcus pneumoniae]